MTEIIKSNNSNAQIEYSNNKKDGNSIIIAFISTIRSSWAPQKIDPPEINSELPYLPLFERIVESIRYNILLTEYSLSSNGGLRAWFKFNLMIFLFLFIPLMMFTPLITYIFYSFANISEYFDVVAKNFRNFSINLLYGTIALTLTFCLIRCIFPIIRLLTKLIQYWKI